MAIENVIEALGACGIGGDRDDGKTLGDILLGDPGYEATDEFKDLERLAPLAQFSKNHYKKRPENLEKEVDEEPKELSEESKGLMEIFTQYKNKPKSDRTAAFTKYNTHRKRKANKARLAGLSQYSEVGAIRIVAGCLEVDEQVLTNLLKTKEEQRLFLRIIERLAYVKTQEDLDEVTKLSLATTEQEVKEIIEELPTHKENIEELAVVENKLTTESIGGRNRFATAGVGTLLLVAVGAVAAIVLIGLLANPVGIGIIPAIALAGFFGVFAGVLVAGIVHNQKSLFGEKTRKRISLVSPREGLKKGCTKLFGEKWGPGISETLYMAIKVTLAVVAVVAFVQLCVALGGTPLLLFAPKAALFALGCTGFVGALTTTSCCGDLGKGWRKLKASQPIFRGKRTYSLDDVGDVEHVEHNDTLNPPAVQVPTLEGPNVPPVTDTTGIREESISEKSGVENQHTCSPMLQSLCNIAKSFYDACPHSFREFELKYLNPQSIPGHNETPIHHRK